MDPKTKVYELLRSFSTTMLVTTARGHRPKARPMQIVSVEEGGDISFLTSIHGVIAEEVTSNPGVLLVLQNERSAYLSVRGIATVRQDPGRVQELWKEAYQVWFPMGVDDPDLALLTVRPVSAEYWDNRGLNRLEYIFEAAKAYLKGGRPAFGDSDQHAKTSL